MKRQKSVFKPIVATSLALALGVSVAVATDPTITTADNGADQSSALEIIWTQNNDGYYQMTSSPVATGNFQFWLETGNNYASNQISKDENNYVVHIAKTTTALTFNGNGNGFQMGDGSGTLSIGGGSERTITLNLGEITDTSKYALKGNLTIGSWGGGVVNATFGGKGISGNLNLNNGASTITLKDGANIEGKLTGGGGTNTVALEGTSTIGGATISGGSTTITSKSTTTDGISINSLFTKTISLSGGTLNFSFADGTDNANKFFNLNTAKTNFNYR